MIYPRPLIGQSPLNPGLWLAGADPGHPSADLSADTGHQLPGGQWHHVTCHTLSHSHDIISFKWQNAFRYSFTSLKRLWKTAKFATTMYIKLPSQGSINCSNKINIEKILNILKIWRDPITYHSTTSHNPQVEKNAYRVTSHTPPTDIVFIHLDTSIRALQL